MRQTEALAAYEALGANLSIATEEAGPHVPVGQWEPSLDQSDGATLCFLAWRYHFVDMLRAWV